MTKQYIVSYSTDYTKCQLAPFTRPKPAPSGPAVYFYLDTKAHYIYRPYLVLVTKSLDQDASLLEFTILHDESAADLSGPHTLKGTQLYDQRYVWAGAPSTAYDVKLNSDKTNNVGFLFLTDDFIKTLTPNPANADISTDGPGDGKFPKGAWASSLVAALSTLLSTEQAERLNPAQRKAMRALLEVL